MLKEVINPGKEKKDLVDRIMKLAMLKKIVCMD